MPDRAWLGHQSWYDLLLAHWPLGAEGLRTMIPKSLELDTYDGVAWLSVVPFRMLNVRLRGLPRACGLAFPELNVRTYVRHGNRSGVFFFSLDATSLAVVILGRRLFGLPYFRARISMDQASGQFRFDSERTDRAAVFSATYEGGATIQAPPGSLDAWLTERYCFYSQHADGRVLRCDIHHRPWPLQHAVATISRNGLSGTLSGIDLDAPPALLHYSRGVDVVFWSAACLTRLGS
jgi:uncharacterized protein YqjF (DUF2071 family)